MTTKAKDPREWTKFHNTFSESLKKAEKIKYMFTVQIVVEPGSVVDIDNEDLLGRLRDYAAAEIIEVTKIGKDDPRY